MKPAPTLIDELYKLSFRTKLVDGWRSNSEMRWALQSAKRFVASDKMSAFMGDLANEAFMKAPGRKAGHRIADSLCVSARLPHESIWIEYDLHAYQGRSHEIRNLGPPDYPEIPEREGWLIQQHPKLDTAYIMHLFTRANRVHEDGYAMWTFPFAFGWTCDGSPLPWHKMFRDEHPNWEKDEVELSKRHPIRKGIADVGLVREFYDDTVEDVIKRRDYRTPASCLVGLAGYHRVHVNCVRSPLIDDPNPDLNQAYVALMTEWTGVIRRVWALLATIDHLPLTYATVRTSKGFLAPGRIRKFLDHQTITLNIPAKKDTRVIARKAIATAHRKRHEVRAHWRDDFRHPPSKRCNPHIWEFIDADDPDTIECAQCRGRQFHIHKHERGDASLGWVTHDYRLKHNEEDDAA